MSSAKALKLRIEGMDCGACAVKIENAMKRLPGVTDINVSYGRESLALSFDEDRSSQHNIEAQIRALGFTPVREGAVGTRASAAERESLPFWAGKKAKLVWMTGLAFAVAVGIAQFFPQWERWAYSAAAFVGIIPVVRRAYASAITGTPFSIETLMSVAALGALAIDAAEEAAVVIFLFAVGELLETVAAGRARSAIKALMDLAPRQAIREQDGKLETVPVEQLAIGDIAIVRPGDRVPSDGSVLEGISEVNEAPITGESVPVAKEPGANLYAGSINGNAELRMSISRAASDNTIARIIHMVEEAQESKAPLARFIDRFSSIYTPVAMVVSLLIVIVPPLLFGGDWMTWIYRGLATLLIACPCALVISTPAAIASGLAVGARRGLLVKGGAALETLGKLKTVAFDKTGTLTEGRPRITDIVTLNGTEDEVLARAAAVERKTSHPLGAAIVEAAEARNLELPQSFGAALAIPGKAVTARLKSGFASVGSPRYAEELAPIEESVRQTISALEQAGKTVVVVLAGKRIDGLIALRDEPRQDAAQALKRLADMGIKTVMLTGDNRRTGDAIGRALGVGVQAELLPEAKLAAIDGLKQDGHVAMVGDGINDAPALATASVGVAMGGGTDVALETADAALLQNRVMGIADLIDLSRATLGNIWQNIGLALGLKAIFLVTTILGVTTLWMAILADTGATVLVTANALRLLRYRSQD
ncbi:heavy metal translocating P-type ATPase [Nitrosomonas eutropha]|uniref:P-type Zn(2+) transporter n=2 Tax=Nitrosomonas eutropha TaxID=916 RepID=A0ABX5MDH9_9PROT|nr:heavy metal translocating P-type ATPase [Nitrosomonas eutropha]ABI58372.1 heavy metal translocating P-type ATPase [Nitrosomonas eutropha C91]PXV84197.1 Cd2+/Zn2+-exporting ATPase [Nitrosomonas eutropha]